MEYLKREKNVEAKYREIQHESNYAILAFGYLLANNSDIFGVVNQLEELKDEDIIDSITRIKDIRLKGGIINIKERELGY